MAKPKIKRFRLNAFTGGMNTISEDNALLSVDPNAALGPAFTQVKTEFRRLENWVPANRGGLSKIKGFALHKAVGSGVVTGLHRFIKSDGTSQFLITHGTTLYKLVSGTLTSLYSSLSNNAYTDFTTADNYVIICDGVNDPIKYDGTTVTTLGGNPPTAAKQSLFYKNRVWMFSDTIDPSLVFYSDGGDIEGNYDQNFVQCDENDGQKVTGIREFFIPGELEPVIVVTKERSAGIIMGDGTDLNPFTFIKTSFDFGCLAFRAIQQFSNDVAWLSPQGPLNYRTTAQNVNLLQESLSKNIRDQFTGLLQTNIDSSMAWLDWKNNLLSFAVPEGSNQYPNCIWHLDLENGGWSKQTGFNITAVMVDTDGTIYFGDDDGDVFISNGTEDNYNGNSIVAVAQTGFIDFFEPDYYKRIRHATLQMRGDGTHSLGVSTSLDYGTKIGSSHTLTLGGTQFTWGGGTWTNNPATYQWGGTKLTRKTFYPKGIFKNLDFSFTQSGADQAVDIFELDIEVEYLEKY